MKRSIEADDIGHHRVRFGRNGALCGDYRRRLMKLLNGLAGG
jgi:hypothetical protein